MAVVLSFLQIKVETRPWSIELHSRKLEVELTTISRCAAAPAALLDTRVASNFQLTQLLRLYVQLQSHITGMWHVRFFTLHRRYCSH
jgi:hypothetical protein